MGTPSTFNAARNGDVPTPSSPRERGDIDIPPAAAKRAKKTPRGGSGRGGVESEIENVKAKGSEDVSSYGLLDWLLRAQPTIAATFKSEVLPLLEQEAAASYARAAARRRTPSSGGAAAATASSSSAAAAADAAVTVARSTRASYTRKTLGRGHPAGPSSIMAFGIHLPALRSSQPFAFWLRRCRRARGDAGGTS